MHRQHEHTLEVSTHSNRQVMRVMYAYVSLSLYIYIHIQRERERGRRNICTPRPALLTLNPTNFKETYLLVLYFFKHSPLVKIGRATTNDAHQEWNISVIY
jgi:hypothetical protein